jgi:succinyl-diaminopimelate desuccinylase
VIPQRASAKLNTRFNTNHTGESLFAWIKETAEAAAARHGASAALTIASQSVCFYTPPGDFTNLVSEAVRESFGAAPELTTTGGTSDARYIRNYCPVVELGLRNETAHMVDEHCAVEDVRTLARCYEAVLRRYFAT